MINFSILLCSSFYNYISILMYYKCTETRMKREKTRRYVLVITFPQLPFKMMKRVGGIYHCKVSAYFTDQLVGVDSLVS